MVEGQGTRLKEALLKERLHPSFLQLDRYVLDQSRDHEGIQRHLDHCEGCRQHVGTLKQSRPVPRWALDLESGAQPRRLQLGLYGKVASASLVALAAVWLLVPADDHSFTTVKGHSSVALYIKRGNRVSLWDGSSPIQPNDRLRLKVVSEGFSHLMVLTTDMSKQRQRLMRLHRAKIDPKKPYLVPTAWRVDEQHDAEVLIVVLSRFRVSKETVSTWIDKAPDPSVAWLRRIVIPKRVVR